MISEPELTGGLDPLTATPQRGSAAPSHGGAWLPAQYAPRHETAAGPPPDLVAGPGPGLAARLRARMPRHWTWALGGAALASAVWAVGIAAWDPTHPAPPDLHGYRLADNPCAGAALRPLFDAAPARSFASDPADVVRGPALDASRCSAQSTAVAGRAPTDTYTAVLTVELHKKTDPRPEFEDQHTLPHTALTVADTVEPVAGLGDEAYLLRQDPSEIGLEVLRGGVVLRLEFTVTPAPAAAAAHPDGSSAPAQPRLSRFRPALIAAMRTVMAQSAAVPHTGAAGR